MWVLWRKLLFPSNRACHSSLRAHPAVRRWSVRQSSLTVAHPGRCAFPNVFPDTHDSISTLKTFHFSAAELTSDNRSDTGLRGILVQPLEVRDSTWSRGRKKPLENVSLRVYVGWMCRNCLCREHLENNFDNKLYWIPKIMSYSLFLKIFLVSIYIVATYINPPRWTRVWQ